MEDTDLDINKIAAEFISSNAESIWSKAASEAKGLRNLVRSKFERTYRTYLERILERYSRGKSFFIRSEPVPIYQFFVPLDLSTQRRVLRKPSMSDIAKDARRSVIAASGGSGKTMIMRHLLISAVYEKAKTPIFLELRQLNDSEENVRSALLRTLRSNGLEVDDEYFGRALGAGHFCVMLDGFDELQYSRRKGVSRELRELAERYPENWLVVSSRPEPQLQGLSSFTQFQVQPLDLERAAELVRKLPFDERVKKKFGADLSSGLFQRHKSFLSNPLLLSIMVLTYNDVASIPDKLSVFYAQAYESLFQKHDALKGGFQRERRSNLDIQDFARVFSAFCIQSLDRREFSFTQSRALDLLGTAKRMTQLHYETQAFLDDALQAACLLLEDGLEITFAHRSFQEYFAARFIDSCPPDVKPNLVQRFAGASDSVVPLLYELDAFAVEQHYVLPFIRSLKDRIKVTRAIGRSHFLRFLKAVFDRFEFEPRDGEYVIAAVIKDTKFFYAYRFVVDRYVPKADLREAEERRSTQDLLHGQMLREFGEDRVSVSALTIRSKFVRTMFDKGPWGAAELRAVLAAERTIDARHRERRASLDTILTGI